MKILISNELKLNSNIEAISTNEPGFLITILQLLILGCHRRYLEALLHRPNNFSNNNESQCLRMPCYKCGNLVLIVCVGLSVAL